MFKHINIGKFDIYLRILNRMFYFDIHKNSLMMSRFTIGIFGSHIGSYLRPNFDLMIRDLFQIRFVTKYKV